MSLPKTTDAWVIQSASSNNGWENLKLEKDQPIPELGEHDCLVQIQAVSLNYRDLIIPQVRQWPKPVFLENSITLTIQPGHVSAASRSASCGLLRRGR